jgi:hypothetical protein
MLLFTLRYTTLDREKTMNYVVVFTVHIQYSFRLKSKEGVT